LQTSNPQSKLAPKSHTTRRLTKALASCPLSTMSSDSRAALLKASTPPSDKLFSTLVSGNHILHYNKVLDAYGHISVRNPQNPATFFISRSLAPALVSSREDIEEYYVEDATPVNKDSPKGYAERFIHSELYKSYKDVNSVIHSHSEVSASTSLQYLVCGADRFLLSL